MDRPVPASGTNSTVSSVFGGAIATGRMLGDLFRREAPASQAETHGNNKPADDLPVYPVVPCVARVPP